MEEQIDDVRINQVTEVITPHQLMQEAPLDPNIIQSVFDSRDRISKILHKKDDRLLFMTQKLQWITQTNYNKCLTSMRVN